MRRTRGESSASTERAREAVVARCGVGKGMLMVLGVLVGNLRRGNRGGTYRVEGKEGSEVEVAIVGGLVVRYIRRVYKRGGRYKF